MQKKGFTLLELMIVIAIIGILASIALPNYMDYVGRAQASEALKVNEGIKSDIALYYWAERRWPQLGHPVLTSAAQLDGKYFDAGNVSVAPGTGVITTSFNAGINAGDTVIMTPSANNNSGQIITWQCSGSVKPSRLPSSCQ